MDKTKFFERHNGFLWGAAAVLFWSLLTAFSRSLLEILGMFTAGGCIYITGGLAFFLLHPPKRRRFVWKYHGLCGLLAVGYNVLFSIGLGLSANRVQTVEMNLINYTWPLLTLVFSVILFKKKISILIMLLGMLLSFSGLALSSSVLAGIPLTPSGLWQNFCSNPIPYLMMTGAAVSWSLYSNVVTSLDKQVPVDAMPYFMVISGLILLLMRFPFHESSNWCSSVFWQLAVIAVFPICLGYYCWDKSMQTGKSESAIAFSYMTPLFSAICCSILLKVTLPWPFYGACLAVIGGALFCRAAVKPNVK